ncbi:MAG: hypothetical protein WAW59_04530 [Patescibacteria group bacterium]
MRDTVDAYFLGTSSYFDASPSDADVTPSGYSYETFRKIYEKKYTGSNYTNTVFTLTQTKNNKPILIGTTRYRDPTDSQSSPTDAIIVSYPYTILNK